MDAFRKTYKCLGDGCVDPRCPTHSPPEMRAIAGAPVFAREMTKRERMATDFVAALLAHHGINDLDFDGVSDYAVEQADALLKRLAR